MFSKHLWWHPRLHYLEFNDVEAVMNSFDKEFLENLPKTISIFATVLAC